MGGVSKAVPLAFNLGDDPLYDYIVTLEAVSLQESDSDAIIQRVAIIPLKPAG